MGYRLGYHILVLPNQVLLISSVLTNEVLLYVVYPGAQLISLCSLILIMYTCTYASCTFTYVRTYIRIFVYATCTCTYVCMYVATLSLFMHYTLL